VGGIAYLFLLAKALPYIVFSVPIAAISLDEAGYVSAHASIFRAN